MRSLRTREILEQLYEQFYEPIYRYCLYRLFVREVAEDVTSTVFLCAAERIHSFQFRKSGWAGLRSWLYAIAANSVNAYIRETRRRNELLAAACRERTIGPPRWAPSPNDDRRVDWPTLYEAIVRLNPKHQHIIALRFLEGLQTREIARILGIRPGAVRVTLSRAMKRLRASLENPARGESRGD